MRVFFASAFSPAMFNRWTASANVVFNRTNMIAVADWLRDLRPTPDHGLAFYNAIRHAATARLVSTMLAPLAVPPERTPTGAETIPAINDLDVNDRVIVFLPQWRGGRPPETREYGDAEMHAVADGIDVWFVTVIDRRDDQ